MQGPEPSSYWIRSVERTRSLVDATVSIGPPWEQRVMPASSAPGTCLTATKTSAWNRSSTLSQPSSRCPNQA